MRDATLYMWVYCPEQDKVQEIKDRMYTCDLGSYVSMTRLHSLSSLRSMSASGPKYLVIFGVLVYA